MWCDGTLISKDLPTFRKSWGLLHLVYKQFKTWIKLWQPWFWKLNQRTVMKRRFLFTNRYGAERQKSLSSDCTLFTNADYAFRASSGMSTSQRSDGCDIDMRTSGTTWSCRLMVFEKRVCNMLRLLKNKVVWFFVQYHCENWNLPRFVYA